MAAGRTRPLAALTQGSPSLTTTTKSFEATSIAIAEESFLAGFSDTTVLSIPGEMIGSTWADRHVSLTEAKQLLMGPAADACDRVWAMVARNARL